MERAKPIAAGAAILLIVLVGSVVTVMAVGDTGGPSAAVTETGPTNLTVDAPNTVGADENVTATVRVESGEENVRAVLYNETGRVVGAVRVRPDESGVDRIDFGPAPTPGRYTVRVVRNGTVVARESVRVATIGLSVTTDPGIAYMDEVASYRQDPRNASVTVTVRNAGDSETTVRAILSVENETLRTRNLTLPPGARRQFTFRVLNGSDAGRYPFTLRVGNVTHRGELEMRTTTVRMTPTPSDPTVTPTPDPTPTQTRTETRTPTADVGTTTPAPDGNGDGQSAPGFGAVLAVLAVLLAILVAIRRTDG